MSIRYRTRVTLWFGLVSVVTIVASAGLGHVLFQRILFDELRSEKRPVQ